MKVTLELPDDLVRRVKLRAVESDRKLKDTLVTLLKAGLRDETQRSARTQPPKPIRLRGRGPLVAVDIEHTISRGRDQ